jgi:hypothetical protein
MACVETGRIGSLRGKLVDAMADAESVVRKTKMLFHEWYLEM